MKNWLIGAVALAVFATSIPFEAEAKRLGGNKSSGMQRSMPARTAPDAPPAKPATPAQSQQAAPANAAPTNAAAATAAAAPAAAAKRSWLGPIAGLAAGLGLVALMSHLGMGEAFANFLMLALLAVAVVALVVFLMRRFGGGGMARQPALAGAAAGAGAGSPGSALPWQATPRELPREEPAPMQRTALNEQVSGMPAEASTAPGADTVAAAFVPAAFDADGFARTAKMIFIRLQAANDTADLDDLKRFTTPELFASLRMDILERSNDSQHTDVQKVEAEVLDVANDAERQIVSVRFHGQLVEEKGGSAVDFNEVWHLVKPHDDSRSWAIAGIEQMN